MSRTLAALALCVMALVGRIGAGDTDPTLTAPSADSIKFAMTGAYASYVVPEGTTKLQIDACGAAGGVSGSSGRVPNYALGGYISSVITVTPGSTLFVYVGGFGGRTDSSLSGYNGGGTGGNINWRGGGATDIRTSSTASLDTQDTRLVVAGGAGAGNCWGCSDYKAAGDGGGLQGQFDSTGLVCSQTPSPCSDATGSVGSGQGGSQTAAGQSSPWSFWNCNDRGGQTPPKGKGANCDQAFGAGAGYYGGGSGAEGGGGGSSFTVATGTILVNTRGDSRCTGDGVLYISPWVPPPSTVPTPSPTPQPSRPTTPPTPQPTSGLVPATDAKTLVYTFHKGESCKFDPVGYLIKSVSLGECIPSNSVADQYMPFKLTCAQSRFPSASAVMTLRKQSYADFACAQPSGAAAKVAHEEVCVRNEMLGMSGVSAQANCLAGLDVKLWRRDQVLTRSFFQSPTCTPGPGLGAGPGLVRGSGAAEVVSVLLGVCSPVRGQGQRGGMPQYHRVLTYKSGDGVATDLVLQAVLYGGGDTKCANSIVDSRPVLFPKSDGFACIQDPLLPQRYYSNVARTTDLSASQFSWVSADFYTPTPTTPPTARPTP